MKIKSYFSALLLFVALGLNAGTTIAAVDSKGTDFFFSFSNNIGVFHPTVLITSDFDATGSIEVPGINYVQPFTVHPGEVLTIELPRSVVPYNTYGKFNTGIRIVADNEITVYGLNQSQYSTDAFLALPVDALGIDYLTMNYAVLQPAQIAITGVYDNTEVTITPTANGSGGVYANQTFTITLNRFENYYLWGQDFTGTVIRSTAPVSVTSGVQCAYVPAGVAACDHLVEMMPPVSTWGKSFLTVPFAIRRRGDVFRVLASEDNTVVAINGAEVATLNRGRFYETVLTTESQIESTKPILLVQYAVGQNYDGVLSDPFMMIVPPTEQFLDRYNFSTLGADLGYNDSYVNVVIPTSNIDSVVLDGSLVDPALFVPIGSSGFSGAKVLTTPGTHNISSSVPFGIYVYGFIWYESYGYIGGMSFDLINPQGDIYPPNVRLTPIGDVIEGVAEDSEDLNINGVLDAGEDLNANGTIDMRSEDINHNGILDAGEDANGNGILDRDTGIFRIELEPGAVNLQVTLSQFVPGSTRANFTVSRINTSQAGQGTLVIMDGAGNRVTRPIELGSDSVLSNVRVVSTLSSDRIDLDATSFTVPPDSINVVDGQTVIEWRFGGFDIGQIQDLGFDVFLRNPVPGESKVITNSVDLYYTDVNGNEVHSGLGSQVVDVLSSMHTVSGSTDRSQYTVNENVIINAAVSSLSDFATSTTARVRVQDSTGALVSEMGLFPNTAISANGTVSLPVGPFNTGTYYEGMYVVLVELLDTNNQVYASASAPFVIGSPSATTVSATVSTDKLVYAPYETVNILDRVRNIVPNVTVDNLTATTTIYEPGGLSFWSQTVALPQLLPDSLRDTHYSVPLGRALAGTYRVLLVVRDEQGIERALSEKTFTVQSSAATGAGLIGTIAASPKVVLKTETLTITANVNNLGNEDLQNLPVTLSIIDPVNAQIVQQWTQPLSTLATQTEYPIAQGWQAIGPEGAAYVAVLSTEIAGQTKTLAQDSFIIGPKFNAQLSIGDKARLLVWLSGSQTYCCSDDDHYSDDSEHEYGSYSYSTSGPSLADQKAYLSARLQEAGWQQFKIVTSLSDFTRELHRGGYTVYTLLGSGIDLNDELEQELTESVNRGEGLVIAGKVSDEPDDALGVDSETDRYADGITLLDSPLHPAGQLTFSKRLTVEGVRARGAEIVGNYPSTRSYSDDDGYRESYRDSDDGYSSSSNTVGITRYAYGAGRSVFIGFNLLTEAMAKGTTDNDFVLLLRNALNDVHPDPLTYSEGLVVPVTFNLTNRGVATTGQVTLSLPASSTVINSGAAQQSDPTTLVWPFNLGDHAGGALTFWLQLPHDLNPVVINAAIQSGSSTALVDHTPATLSLAVTLAASLDDMITQLSPLAGLNYRFSYALNDLQKARYALTNNRPATAHYYLLEAAEELSKLPLSQDAIAIRTKLDWLIRDMAFGL